jgi:membrane associated rhomboid family serine protease
MLEEFKNAFQRHNNGHVQLIIINVVVFLAMAVLMVVFNVAQAPEVFTFIHQQIAIPAAIGDFLQKPWTIITYAFAHDLTGILHIFFNMLALYWFGRLFVEYLGSDKVIAVYVLGALAGAVAYLGVYNLVPYYAERFPVGMVGASAGIRATVSALLRGDNRIPDHRSSLMRSEHGNRLCGAHHGVDPQSGLAHVERGALDPLLWHAPCRCSRGEEGQPRPLQPHDGVRVSILRSETS